MRRLIFEALTIIAGLVFAIGALAFIVTDGKAAGNTILFSGLMLFALLYVRPKIQ